LGAVVGFNLNYAIGTDKKGNCGAPSFNQLNEFVGFGLWCSFLVITFFSKMMKNILRFTASAEYPTFEKK
jgi:hypothetical protein